VLNGRSFAAVLWRRRLTGLLVLVVVAAGTLAWLLLAPRTYTATASITATPQASLAATAGTAANLQDTVAALADSQPVVADAVGDLGPERSVAVLQSETWAERVDGTAIIRIHVEDRDRHYAARAADAVAAVLPQHDPTGGQLLYTGVGSAAVPTSFTSPDIATSIVVGAVLAVLAGLAAVLTREVATGRVEDQNQLTALVQAPVLASVSRPRDPGEMPGESTPAAVATQFRALRVALEFATSDDPTSLVVMAPAVPDDAAAWTAVHLAGALAQVEHRVLIIDADFGARVRHPALKSNGPGLADVLRGKVELRDAVRPTPIAEVSVLPAGNLDGASPANLLELRFHHAIAALEKEVDLVLVLAPALSESDDARVMAAGNALLLAVPAKRVRARIVRGLAAELRRMRLRVIGTVLIGGPQPRRK
jgi:Mrp family chromosome partitioning ATPase